VQKSKKVRIHKIMPEGNTAFSDRKIKRMLKETKEHVRVHPFAGLDTLFVGVGKAASRADLKGMFSEVGGYVTDNIKLNIFKSSKYITSNYRGDKEALIAKYNEKGYRDAQVVWDSVYMIDQKRMNIRMRIQEGHKYYFRDIKWIGNTKYATKDLQRLMGINKGDVYDPIRLSSRLSGDANGGDISALYMDDGYLFFDIQPVEVFVEGDSVDIEIRIREGQQARINKVTISGNTKTNDHVILREIRTKPGQLFSRSDIIRSQQQLASLGYFDAEQLNVIPKPNPEDGTVDIEYVVAERPSDQIELSGGWGGNRIVGTLGVVFTNFSTRNFFKKGAWTPLPSGDGQRLSLRASTNGRFFQSYNFSFTEPWLGGKKPNSFSIGASYSHQSNGADGTITDDEGNRIDNPDHQSINIIGLSLGLGKQLTVPDDYFSLLLELNYQHYDLDNWRQFIFNTGKSNNLFGRITLSRTSIDRPIYPRRGSRISISSQLTLPYSKFDDKDYANLENQEKYRWIEYHKWKVTSDWYNTIFENLVLRTKVGFGFLGHYNDEIGPAPFERFYLGGSGLTGFQLDGREIIALRGYDDNSISPSTGSTIISKYTMELRYPFSLNPSATIYGLAFVEAGNTWGRFGDFNPFSVNRSAGVGIRIFLPMFGLLGLDWGRRFDDIPGRPNMSPAQIHFTIGANLGEL
ncbi:MAG: POTRA domain-containing protein, partial [Bacteroidota bacterium]